MSKKDNAVSFMFNVLSSSWEIIEIPGNDSLLMLDGERCQGITYFDSHKIYIDKDMMPDKKRNTLLHELVHAVLFSTQVEVKKKYTEENLCDFIGMYGDLIHNTADLYFKQQRNEKILS